MFEEQVEFNAENVQENTAKSDVEIRNPDNTAIPNQEDLILNKQSFIASGNTAQFQQIFFNPIIHGNNANGMFRMRETNAVEREESDKQYNLENEAELVAFVEAHGGDEYYVNAIVLCVFDYVLINDLQNLKSKLQDYLPPNYDSNGNEIRAKPQFYISLNNILNTIKGKCYTIEDGERCVGLGEETRKKALKHVWTQFPFIRDSIVKWLVNISESYDIKTSFDAIQICNAFINILKMDYSWGTERLLTRLYSDTQHAWLLGGIALDLYQDELYHERILCLILKWLQSGSEWLWKPAIFVFAGLSESQSSDLLRIRVINCLKKRICNFSNSDVNFYSQLLWCSEPLRSCTTKVIDMLYSTYNSKLSRLSLVNSYLRILLYCYYYVSRDNLEFPLVACDNKKQQLELRSSISQICSVYDLKKSWLGILQAYLREISRYSRSKTLTRRLTAYFGGAMIDNPRYKEDINLMLSNSECRAATEILEYCKCKNI
jgi:hypothetical protein